MLNQIRWKLALSVGLMILLAQPSTILAQTKVDDPEKQPTRQWLKDDESARFQATFLEYNPDSAKVTLRLNDDTVIEIPKTDLSTRDQLFLKRHVLKLKRIAKREAHAKTSSGNNATDREANLDVSKRDRAPSRNASLQNDVRRLYGIDWHSSPEAAKTVASGKEGKKDDRPIIWFRVLGDLGDGM